MLAKNGIEDASEAWEDGEDDGESDLEASEGTAKKTGMLTVHSLEDANKKEWTYVLARPW